MDPRKRMTLIRLIERIEQNPEYSKKAGISDVSDFTENDAKKDSCSK